MKGSNHGSRREPGTPLMEFRDFTLSLKQGTTLLPLLKGLSFSMHRGESLAIVGESGCGKTLTAKSIMRLLDHGDFVVTGGSIHFAGEDVLKMSEQGLLALRGKKIAMIFQEPMTALNPVFTIGEQIEEVLMLHLKRKRSEARQMAVELLDKVGIPEPGYRFHSYPHELSGGMRQRAMIAMAISCNPELLIADEPTTSLDVTVQAQILDLLERLRDSVSMGFILVTHDLGIVWKVARKVIIMYAGYIVEKSPVKTLFRQPLHPYTKGLLKSVPSGDALFKNGRKPRRLDPIPGNVPSMDELGPGCPFAPRCSEKMPVCTSELPDLFFPESGCTMSEMDFDCNGVRQVRCHLYGADSHSRGRSASSRPVTSIP